MGLHSVVEFGDPSVTAEQERVLRFMKIGGLSADAVIGLVGVGVLMIGQRLLGSTLLICALVELPLTYLMVARRRKALAKSNLAAPPART
jgi:hypothetical protein